MHLGWFTYDFLQPYILIIFATIVTALGALIKLKFFSSKGRNPPQQKIKKSDFNIEDRNQPQSDLNNESDMRYKMVIKRLEETIIEAEHYFSNKIGKSFTKSQTSWKKYSEDQAKLEAERFNGGSIKPLIYSQTLIRLAELRIEEIKSLIKDSKL